MQITSKLKYLLLVVIFLLPLLQANKGFGYEQIKVFFFIIGLTVCGILWIIYSAKYPFKIVWSGINKAAVFFICILFLTSFLGIDAFNSFIGTEPYFQGFIFYAYLYLFFLLISWLKVKINHWAYILIGSSTIVSLLAIKDWVLQNLFHQIIPSYAGRVVSTFGQPNFYAGFLLLSLPFAYLLFKSPNRRLSILGWGSGIISLIAILISYSRSTILLSLILIIVALISQLKTKFKLVLVVIPILLLLISIFIALKYQSGLVGNEVSQPILTSDPDLTKESIEKRVYIWPLAFKIAIQKPLTGYGLENISKSFSDYFEANKHSLFEENLKISPVLISLKELNINRSHNYLLDLLLFSGILGLLGWLWLLGVLFKKLRNLSHSRERNVLVVSLVTYLVWIQFQNQSIVHLIYFWLLVGVIDRQNG